MKAQQLLQPWKGDKRWTEMSKRAASLKKSGRSEPEIVAAITAEFGSPVTLQRLHSEARPLKIYGERGTDIDPSAIAQMELALKLPIAISGALMPDAHVGYALPIGGVFAAHRAVSPAMVGVDIGCRMHLSIFDDNPDDFLLGRKALFRDLQDVTTFGAGQSRPIRADHAILDSDQWTLTSQISSLKTKAIAQLGTSGSGNHFAELVVGERLAHNSANAPALPQRFCGLLTHSGSRGIGYSIANTYMRLAEQETKLHSHAPKMYEWLSLDGDAGREYWAAMHLAGDYAQANHEVIHADFAKRAGLSIAQTIQNHHNFAWQEGDTIIHRKGATPAGVGTLGVIPGSMATASYLVSGNGVLESLCSASHGAGRVGSRASARDRLTLREVSQYLADLDVWVAGLSVDEAPQAYKDIERVMQLQVDAGLVTPLARMQPIAVIMAGEPGKD